MGYLCIHAKGLSSVDVIDVMIYGSISVITDLIVDMC